MDEEADREGVTLCVHVQLLEDGAEYNLLISGSPVSEIRAQKRVSTARDGYTQHKRS